MFDIVDVEREWAKVCPVDAHTIQAVRAARRLPAHRLEPHAEFSAVFWKLVAFHPDVVWAVSTPGCSMFVWHLG